MCFPAHKAAPNFSLPLQYQTHQTAAQFAPFTLSLFSYLSAFKANEALLS